ncbi:hypothetical protein BpHYR1_044128 [Brachionus plicatilis]|uniref:Uncharacterized protein n=1 Tax=Brachionus plicatilis TaxID=10195 RepID=A0A3M7SX29_BRAPC|nr:hypothetical protein BpHYR1_044128 [Brachionus plicatilis]
MIQKYHLEHTKSLARLIKGYFFCLKRKEKFYDSGLESEPQNLNLTLPCSQDHGDIDFLPFQVAIVAATLIANESHKSKAKMFLTIQESEYLKQTGAFLRQIEKKKLCEFLSEHLMFNLKNCRVSNDLRLPIKICRTFIGVIEFYVDLNANGELYKTLKII